MELEVFEPIVLPELQAVTKQSGVQKADYYAAKFAPFMINVKELSQKVSAINHEQPTLTDSKLAREVRLALVKNRTATSKEKDESKAALLNESNLIQSLHNVVVNASQLIEADLTKVEKYAEIKEAERVAALHAERVDLMQPYIESFVGVDFGKMGQEQFDLILKGAKLAHDAKLEEARLAEEKRLAEEAERLAEQERIRLENERLKEEAAKMQAKLKKEQEIAAKKLAAERAEREKVEAEQRAIAEAARIKAEEEAAKKQAEIDTLKAEADRIAKIEAERLLEAERVEKLRLAEAKKAAKAPDKQKIKEALNLLPAFYIIGLKDEKAKVVADEIRGKYNSFKKWAEGKIEEI